MLPLESLSWDVEVAGPVAEIVVHQRFVNASSRFVDATYLFPLASDAVIDGMTLRIGPRVIRSVVQTRDEARATYEAAADAGKVAALVSDRAIGMYAQEVANIPPWSSVEVELSLVQPARRVGQEWEVVLPLVAAPRMETFALMRSQAEIDALSTSPVRDRMGVPVSITVDIHTAVDLRAVVSPTHLVEVDLEGNVARASIWGAQPDRDFVVRWSTVPLEEPALALLIGDVHALLEVSPPELAFADRAPRELVWVVDTTDPVAEREIQTVEAGLWHDDVSRRAPSVTAALALAPDRERHRTVVYVGTGAGLDGPTTLAAIARRPDVTVVVLGVGPADRALLEEMARVGGGSAAFDVADFPAALARPLLTDVRVDWDRCPGDQPSPERFPDVRAGEPARVLVHAPRCVGPVWVSAVSNGRRAEWPVWPEYVPAHRALAVTWAKARVTDLQRQELRGLSGDVAPQIREIGLRWGIVTSETSLVAVDTQVSNLTGKRTEVAQVMRGTVMTREFLQKVPTGRSYQSAVQMAAGVQGGMVPRPDFSRSYGRVLLDGQEILDPVSPQLGPALPASAIARVDAITGVPAAYLPDGLPVADIVGAAGTNRLEFDATAQLTSARGHSWGAEGSVSGPIVRDKAWLLVAEDFAAPTLAGISTERHATFGRLTVQPVTEHRFSAAGLVDSGRVQEVAGATWGGALGIARWQWFPTDQSNVDATGSWSRRPLGDDPRERWQADLRANVLGIEDGLEGLHDLRVGVGAAGWSAPGVRQTSLGGYALDVWKPVSNVYIVGGSRLTAIGGRLHPSPRLAASWDPWKDQKTKIAAGLTRTVDTGRIAWAGAPIQRDEATATLEREVIDDLAVGVDGSYRAESLPLAPSPDLVSGVAGPFPTLDRRVLALTGRLRKVESHRWAFSAEYARTRSLGPVAPSLLADPSAPWIPGFLEAYREHRLSGVAYWDLPTDPWRQTISVAASWGSAIAPGGAWWLEETSRLGLRMEQEIDVRKGHLTVSGELGRSLNDPTATVLPLEVLVLVPGAPDPGEQPPWRGTVELEYRF